MASGSLGGIAYWLACYPLDIVKSRVQLGDRPPEKGGWGSGGYVMREIRTILGEGGM